MNRRSFLMTTVAALAAAPSIAATSNYTPGHAQALLAEGKTVFLEIQTTWCTTCAAQARVIKALKGANPAYGDNIEFVYVDWDDYRSDPFIKSLNIPRRSTLVALKGDAELGRIVAGTSTSVIHELMDTALAAATSA